MCRTGSGPGVYLHQQTKEKCGEDFQPGCLLVPRIRPQTLTSSANFASLSTWPTCSRGFWIGRLGESGGSPADVAPRSWLEGESRVIPPLTKSAVLRPAGLLADRYMDIPVPEEVRHLHVPVPEAAEPMTSPQHEPTIHGNSGGLGSPTPVPKHQPLTPTQHQHAEEQRQTPTSPLPQTLLETPDDKDASWPHGLPPHPAGQLFRFACALAFVKLSAPIACVTSPTVQHLEHCRHAMHSRCAACGSA